MSKKYKIYDIHCANCQEYVLTYQKYGAGKAILRLYYENVVAPENFIATFEKKKDKLLRCNSCEEWLGKADLSVTNKSIFKMRTSYFHRKLKK